MTGDVAGSCLPLISDDRGSGELGPQPCKQLIIDAENLELGSYFLELDTRISTTNSSSLSSFSVAGTRQAPHCVSLTRSALRERGYASFEDWNSDPNHVYIGRDMTRWVAGAQGSKWGNPYTAYER